MTIRRQLALGLAGAALTGCGGNHLMMGHVALRPSPPLALDGKRVAVVMTGVPLRQDGVFNSEYWVLSNLRSAVETAVGGMFRGSGAVVDFFQREPESGAEFDAYVRPTLSVDFFGVVSGSCTAKVSIEVLDAQSARLAEGSAEHSESNCVGPIAEVLDKTLEPTLRRAFAEAPPEASEDK